MKICNVTKRVMSQLDSAVTMKVGRVYDVSNATGNSVMFLRAVATVNCDGDIPESTKTGTCSLMRLGRLTCLGATPEMSEWGWSRRKRATRGKSNAEERRGD
jgi:hypothetical protein